MQLWILAFSCGVACLQFFPSLPSLMWLPVLIPLILQHIDFKGNYFCIVPGIKRAASFLFLGFSLGFAWALVYAYWLLAWSLPSQLENKNLMVTGYIASLPQVTASVAIFILDVTNSNEIKIHSKLKLSWYGKHLPLNIGDQWRLLVRLKKPHGLMNPGGFDLEKYLYEHHIRATGYVINGAATNTLLTSNWYDYAIGRLRQKLQQKMLQALLNAPLNGIILALVVGDESKITAPEWQTFKVTGTSYLVAISGLHIGLVAGLAFGLIQFLWRRSSKLPLILPAKQAAAVGALLIAVIYSVVSGVSIPTQRSLVMLSVFLIALFFKRNLLTGNAWFLALFIVLVLDPIAILSIGFWLSFTAVAIIIYVNSGRKLFQSPSISFFYRCRMHCRKFLYLQYSITLGLLPITLWLFQQTSLLAIITNIIAMPVVCLIVVPLSLIGALLLLFPGYIGGWILYVAHQLMLLVWGWLKWWSGLAISNWQQPIFNWWILVAASIGVIILLAPRYFPGKIIGALWVLPLFYWTPPSPDYGAVWVTLLDVGQGLAAVVRTAKHTLIYDSGIKFFDH